MPPNASKPNRLSRTGNPYLLQHAHNPVDWYPWGDEALERARADNRPVFLSIGYSTCHWCHVMERESFSDPRVAEVMNRHFVCIKVDREERPDLDKIYITAVSALTGSAGWPLNVFLTPAGEPFFGGTYFPPRPAPGMPSWTRVLEAVAAAWSDPAQRRGIQETGGRLSAALRAQLTATGASPAVPAEGLAGRALEALARRADPVHGGFGAAPKFPSPPVLDFLLACHAAAPREDPRKRGAQALGLVTAALDGMAAGGIFDHLGGGFHRYSVDERWHVPHFEKMLYDNALLLRTYAQAWRLTGTPRYATVARRTADYLLTDLQARDGGFHSAEDADSRPLDLAVPPAADAPEGDKREGAYFVWRQTEIEALLTPREAEIVCWHYGVLPQGNVRHDPHGEFPGQNVLYRAQDLEAVARRAGRPLAAVAADLERARGKLRHARDRRPRPHRDDKVLTAWNGLAVTGLAAAYQALGEERFLVGARRAADFLLEQLYDPGTGRLFRAWRQGRRHVLATAEDYAFLVQGLLELYTADFQPHWLQQALRLTREAVDLFFDAEHGGFFLTAADHDRHLLMRVKEDQDHVIPSAASVMALNLLRLARWTGQTDLERMAARTIASVLGPLGAHPESAPLMLCAQALQRSRWIQVVVAGPGDREDTRALLAAARDPRLPEVCVAFVNDDAAVRALARLLPQVERAAPVQDRPAAYVCVDRSCREPLTAPDTLAATLAALGTPMT